MRFVIVVVHAPIATGQNQSMYEGKDLEASGEGPRDFIVRLLESVPGRVGDLV